LGNVWEWNETQNGSNRISRGGSYCHTLRGIRLSSSYRVSVDPYHETDSLGFRVASIPEPATVVLSKWFHTALQKIRHMRRSYEVNKEQILSRTGLGQLPISGLIINLFIIE
jgi:hypothetical protein